MRRDPHSHTDLAQGRTVRFVLDLAVDLERRTLGGTCTVHLDAPAAGPLDLDTRDLAIEAVRGPSGEDLPFALGEADPILGQRLRIARAEPIGTVTVHYTTSPTASGLMWLEPAQTASGRPFLLSQCQAIHARSLAPLQDSPRARTRYEAVLRVPEGLQAVMSAAPGEPVDGDPRVLRFTMPQPIPPYLLALAVGRLEARDLGPRTRVWAEPEVVDGAAWEFAEAEAMLEAAEALLGPYRWERYDFVVLPPSFPLGGMENPRMTFLTPTLLAGDRSLVNVLAHELAHSWTGNLVTNADNEHFWLNEGWTVYAERRILEVLEGGERAAQGAIVARARLEQVIADRAAEGRPTALTYDQHGLDPDDEFSVVPYEKGYLLLVALEQRVGRPAFDRFLQAWIEAYAFEVATTDDFLAFLEEHLPDHGLALDPWLHSDGLPADAPTFRSERFDHLAAVAAVWAPGTPLEPATPLETLHTLAHLPDTLDREALRALGTQLGLDGTRNAELRSAWLARALYADAADADALAAFLTTVGRTKLLVPVFRALVGTGRAAEARRWADDLAPRWHSSTRLAVRRLLPREGSDPR